MERVIFNLKRYWEIDGETVDLYEEIKSGRKTSEWRDMSKFWAKRLCKLRTTPTFFSGQVTLAEPVIDLTPFLTVSKAWFVIGYPKGNIPRLEADIMGLFAHNDSHQFEVKFSNIVEVTG